MIKSEYIVNIRNLKWIGSISMEDVCSKYYGRCVTVLKVYT